MLTTGSSDGHITFYLSTIISAKSNATEDKCCSMYFTTSHTKEKNLEAHV